MNQKIRILLFSAFRGLLFGAMIFLNLAANAQNIAQQKFTVPNNGEVSAFASKSEITRIAFEAPVTEIHALSEEIDYVIQGQDIYLRLTTEKPVNFFVKTEDEMTYKLILVASDIPSTQVFIHNKDLRLADTAQTKYFAEYFGQISPELKSRIAKIIEVSLNPTKSTKYLGYNITPKHLNLISPVETEYKSLKMKLIAEVSGNKLISEKIYLRNSSDKPQKLHLKDFASSEYLAVYLAKTELLPKEECVLIRVIEN